MWGIAKGGEEGFDFGETASAREFEEDGLVGLGIVREGRVVVIFCVVEDLEREVRVVLAGN